MHKFLCRPVGRRRAADRGARRARGAGDRRPADRGADATRSFEGTGHDRRPGVPLHAATRSRTAATAPQRRRREPDAGADAAAPRWPRPPSGAVRRSHGIWTITFERHASRDRRRERRVRHATGRSWSSTRTRVRERRRLRRPDRRRRRRAVRATATASSRRCCALVRPGAAQPGRRRRPCASTDAATGDAASAPARRVGRRATRRATARAAPSPRHATRRAGPRRPYQGRRACAPTACACA